MTGRRPGITPDFSHDVPFPSKVLVTEAVKYSVSAGTKTRIRRKSRIDRCGRMINSYNSSGSC